MKIVKMSLVAALLIGSSAFAIENTKVSGDANVFYGTSDSGTSDLFDKDASAADIGLNLNVSSDLVKNDLVSISAGAGYTVVSTLGLENNFVSNVWGGSHTATTNTSASYGSGLGGAKVENANWFNEAWFAVSTGKSTVKLGRMELDTPLAFTEKWTIEKNTFEAAVLINQDLPDTTLVGAFVGNGNGTETFGETKANTVATLGLAAGAVVNADGDFTTYGSDGAYAAGLINNSFKPLTVQAWYYDVSKVASAYWLQADLSMDGIMIGAQYSGLDIDSTERKIKGVANLTDNAVKVDSDAMAVMLGYEMKDVATVKLAYSKIGKDHSAGQNTATNFVGGTAQSKLYTEAWWNYGKITQADTTSYNLTVTSPVQGMFDLGLFYTNADQSAAKGDNDLSEITVTAGKTFGPLTATLAYINADVATAAVGDDETSQTVQAYLTLNF
jgi:hypothetical protein